jgi:leucyl/phenylalanyl-tRNA--protein transferase
VIAHCAGTPRDGQVGTWIVPELMRAYRQWHAAGEVHSFETWIDGELVGGLYGVCQGRMFYGESMFARRTDASKIALAALVAFCRQAGIDWIDCQQQTRHLATMGAVPVARDDFLRHLDQVVELPSPGQWTYHRELWRQLPLEAGPEADPPMNRLPDPAA